MILTQAFDRLRLVFLAKNHIDRQICVCYTIIISALCFLAQGGIRGRTETTVITVSGFAVSQDTHAFCRISPAAFVVLDEEDVQPIC